MEILNKDTISQYMLPNLGIGLWGKEYEKDLLVVEIVSHIILFKTDFKWRQIPL
jgi:hypothetical protein